MDVNPHPNPQLPPPPELMKPPQDNPVKLLSTGTDITGRSPRQTDSVAKVTSGFPLIICNFGEIWIGILRYEKGA